MRNFLVFVVVASATAALPGEEVTLPAAASIVGGAPFFSDVRAFNTSYAEDLTVSARYRCFIPSSCSVSTDSVQFTLTPRESRAFNDIVVSVFNAPDTAGGIEFEHTGGPQQLVVTSRLYSTAPTPTVGMFIPGLPNSDESPTTILTSIRNRGADAGFRTNVGLFNRQDALVNVTFTIFDGGIQIGNPVTRSVGGHSGAQVSRHLRGGGTDRPCHAKRGRRRIGHRSGLFLRGRDRQPHDRSDLRGRRRRRAAAADHAGRDGDALRGDRDPHRDTHRDTDSDRHADVSGRRSYG